MKNKADFEKLFSLAEGARANAHAPYSHFHVGVALMTTDGEYFSGCNVENAAYPSSVCAEVNAVTTMVATGSREIAEVLVIGGSTTDLCSPCGNCRQVIAEFAIPNTIIHICHPEGLAKSVPFSELLPLAFG